MLCEGFGQTTEPQIVTTQALQTTTKKNWFWRCSQTLGNHENDAAPQTKKNANEQTETTKGTSRSFFKICKNTAPKTSNNLPKLTNNWSKMNPGAPPETPRARDLFLKSLLIFVGPKLTPKWNNKRSKKYVLFDCFVDTFCLRFMSEKCSLVVYCWN